MLLRVYVILRVYPLRVYVPCAHTPHMYVLYVYVTSFVCRFVRRSLCMYVPPCVCISVFKSHSAYELPVYVPSVLRAHVLSCVCRPSVCPSVCMSPPFVCSPCAHSVRMSSHVYPSVCMSLCVDVPTVYISHQCVCPLHVYVPSVCIPCAPHVYVVSYVCHFVCRSLRLFVSSCVVREMPGGEAESAWEMSQAMDASHTTVM